MSLEKLGVVIVSLDRGTHYGRQEDILGTCRTSPTGNKRLQTALYMGAVYNLRCDYESRELYARIVGKGKHQKVAIVAVMNKLIRRIHATVQRGTPFVRT